jgi:hypothetical protein
LSAVPAYERLVPCRREVAYTSIGWGIVGLVSLLGIFREPVLALAFAWGAIVAWAFGRPPIRLGHIVELGDSPDASTVERAGRTALRASLYALPLVPFAGLCFWPPSRLYAALLSGPAVGLMLRELSAWRRIARAERLGGTSIFYALPQPPLLARIRGASATYVASHRHESA